MKKSILFYSILLLLSVVCVLIMHHVYPNESGQIITIDSDGKGYYAYLPAVFADHNIQNLESNSAYTNNIDGQNFIKYPVGVAVLLIPFYLIALLFCLLFSLGSDPYAPIFQYAVQAGGLFYSLVGIWFTGRLIALFDISIQKKRWIQISLFLGTNLLYYSLFTTSLSHIYSFAAIAAFAYFVKKYFTHFKTNYLTLSFVALGIVLLIRPFNLLVLLAVPFIAGSLNNIKHGLAMFTQQRRNWLIAIISFLLIVSVQPIFWFIQTGHWVIWSYSNEGFYFNNPQIFEVLFGFRKGWLVYTPIFLLMFPGIWLLRKRSTYSFWTFTGFILVVVYLISSWWNWYYGDSFGHRAFIDYYAIFGIVLAIGYSTISSKKGQIAWKIFTILAIALNLVQSYQYKTDILHHHNMDFQKYAYSFLKTSKEHRNLLGGNKDIQPFSKAHPKIVLEAFNDFEENDSLWQVAKVETVLRDSNSYNKAVIFRGNEFGLAYTWTANKNSIGGQAFWLNAELKRMDFEPNASFYCLMAVARKNENDSLLYYTSFPINDIPAEQPATWNTFTYSFSAPAFQKEGETMTIYLWNKEGGNFAIDDFKLKVYKVD